MLQQELLKRVIQALDRADIPYMITGSVASSLQGEPRATHDVDMLVVIQKKKIAALVKAFKSPDYYLDENSVVNAVETSGMFNLIDVNGGGKVDFWILTEDSFDESRFARRCSENFEGFKMHVSSPEDTILAKLRWAKLSGGSEKQFVDALRVFEVQRKNLDFQYLEAWIKRLGIESFWGRLKNEAELI